MSLRSPTLRERIEILRATGVPVSPADEKRVSDSVAASLQSLDSAVRGSLFDTEPQTFDVVMRKLAKPAAGGAKS